MSVLCVIVISCGCVSGVLFDMCQVLQVFLDDGTHTAGANLQLGKMEQEGEKESCVQRESVCSDLCYFSLPYCSDLCYLACQIVQFCPSF